MGDKGTHGNSSDLYSVKDGSLTLWAANQREYVYVFTQPSWIRFSLPIVFQNLQNRQGSLMISGGMVQDAELRFMRSLSDSPPPCCTIWNVFPTGVSFDVYLDVLPKSHGEKQDRRSDGSAAEYMETRSKVKR